MGREKVARLPFAFAFGYCINFCIYAMLQTWATFLWPTLWVGYKKVDVVGVCRHIPSNTDHAHNKHI
jgi:hypothetical protein